MFRWLPAPLKGVFCWFFLVTFTLLWSIPMYVFFILKYLLPFNAWREFFSDRLHWIGENWSLSNKWYMDQTQDVSTWEVHGMPELKRDKWYFIACNHQTWSDVLIISYLFSGKMPFIKYFVKDTLKYFPIIGIAWWAFEFPMMKRHSPKKLAKKPHLREKDIQTTLGYCKKYLRKPSTILSFVEGTRYSPKKHGKQKSPFKHLLKPKPGGFALTVKAMGEHIDSFIHVTIVYPEGRKSFWDFMCGRVTHPKVLVEEVAIPEHFKYGDYANDQQFRESVKNWLYDLWHKKDQQFDQLLKQN